MKPNLRAYFDQQTEQMAAAGQDRVDVLLSLGGRYGDPDPGR